MHFCNYKFNVLILLISFDFKTPWKMFTLRGEVCNADDVGKVAI